MKTLYDQCLERATGKTMAYLRDTPIDEQRLYSEQKQGKSKQYISYFPLIGRGSVLGSRAVSHEEVARMFEEAVKYK